MPRKRRLVKIPFLKFKINKQTVFNIFGFLILTSGLVLLLSFFKGFSSENQGRILYYLNQGLKEKFGFLSIFIPFILIFIAGHFFNSKKLKFIKPNISLGIILVFISLLGVFQSGLFGRIIFENLSLDFSSIGAVLILTIIFIIGLILFLDTSVDVFFIFLFNLFKNTFLFIKTYFFRGLTEKYNDKKVKETKKEEKEFKEFIEDKKISEEKQIKTTPPLTPTVYSKSELMIKPITSASKSVWIYPPISLLIDITQKEADRGDVKKNAFIIEKTLESFGIRARVSEINYGPAVTQYALEITMGTKLSRITALANDLALAIAAPTGQVRIEAPIPGRSLVGIEIPNRRPEIVTLKKLLSSPIFIDNNDPLLVPLGLDVSGQSQATTIAKMPHALIAGATGSGKSVLLNAWISTFLFRTKPEDLRLILVDPKRVELTLYNGIPHLLTEVVTEPDKIISALRWTVAEMENRYKEFAKVGVRNLEGYNSLENVEKKPYIVFIIDELADLMLFAPGDAEDLITRIAQMARATGIHLVLATQRPSVDVITGLMKANIPCRVAFNVSSMVDSRVIIDMPGAEKLLGKGDMLFLPPDQAKPKRIQGPFITEKEVNQLVKFIKAQNPEVHYTEEVTQLSGISKGGTTLVSGTSEDKDPLFDESVKIILQHDKASASLLQRRLSIGYARAARILDQLEAAGYVGPAEGSKPREVIKRQQVVEEEI
ncbi:MAG: DNA translocase FtsK [Patescibacteria group bacterium]|nr:DNA translocase FtsK [Patescibacteria group bacterium]